MYKSFILAPMAELSHRALRELIEGFGGCDEYFTEMISAGALLAGGPFEKWYVDGGPCPEKVVYQLVGADIGQITGAAALLDRLECRGIDLNMGCCAPLIRKTGAGITWMASVDRAGELVKSVRGVVKRRLSVKMRTGLTDNFDYLVKFCRRLEEEGVDLIILHPRTAKEKLKRRARWDYVGALRQELRIPVAGNGDIVDAEGLIARAGGCDAVMVGRAAVRQPWIFAEARSKYISQRREGAKDAEGREGEGEGKGSKYISQRREGAKDAEGREGEEGKGSKYISQRREGAKDAEGREGEGEGKGSKYISQRREGAKDAEGREGEEGKGSKYISQRREGAKDAEGREGEAGLEEIGGRFLELLGRWQPVEFHVSRARRFFGLFCDNLQWGNYVKNLLNREETLSGIERAWRGYFRENPHL